MTTIKRTHTNTLEEAVKCIKQAKNAKKTVCEYCKLPQNERKGVLLHWRGCPYNKRMALVLAGNKGQFIDWMRLHPMHVEMCGAKYLIDKNSAKGIHDADLFKTGTWYMRRDAQQIIEECLANDIVEIKDAM